MTTLRSNIWKFYVFQFMTGVSFFAPIIVLFWQQNGLSMTQIMLLQSIFSLAMVLLDLPTGYLADVFGRKKTLVVAGIFLALGATIYSMGHSFGVFLLAELSWGVGLSLISGADNALLYDTLKELGEEERYTEILGNSIFYSTIAMMATQLIGGLLAKIDYRWTLIACIPFMLSTIPLAFSLREPRRKKHTGPSMTDLKAAVSYIVNHEKLRWLIIFAGVTYGCYQSVLWLYQPYFQLTGLDVVYYGAIFASFQVVAAFSGKYAHVVEKKLGQWYSLILIVVLTTVAYLLLANLVMLFSFVFAFLTQFVRGFHKVVISKYINTHTKSEIRATILSAQSMVGKFLYALIIPVIGWIVDVYSLTQALTVLGVTSGICGGALLLLIRLKKVV